MEINLLSRNMYRHCFPPSIFLVSAPCLAEHPRCETGSVLTGKDYPAVIPEDIRDNCAANNSKVPQKNLQQQSCVDTAKGGEEKGHHPDHLLVQSHHF